MQPKITLKLQDLLQNLFLGLGVLLVMIFCLSLHHIMSYLDTRVALFIFYRGWNLRNPINPLFAKDPINRARRVERLDIEFAASS